MPFNQLQKIIFLCFWLFVVLVYWPVFKCLMFCDIFSYSIFHFIPNLVFLILQSS